MIESVVFVFGLVVGSFLNAVTYRLSIQLSAFKGRSFCPSCKHELGAKDLVPVVSFILLRGRCRYCRKSISWHYPVVELVTGVSFVLLFVTLQAKASGAFVLATQFMLYAAITSFLIIIFVYDLRHYLILDKVIIPAIVVAFIGNLVLGHAWWLLLTAAVATGGFFAAQFLISKGRWIGGGDIRLGAFMGVALSWPQVLIALFLGYLLGSIVGVGLLASGRKTMSSKVPFGTFLSVATYVTMLYGTEILNWYQEAALL